MLAVAMCGVVSVLQDALLHETSVLVQQWQYRCQDLRSRHEAVLTHGIGTPATQDTPGTGAAAEQ